MATAKGQVSAPYTWLRSLEQERGALLSVSLKQPFLLALHWWLVNREALGVSRPALGQ